MNLAVVGLGNAGSKIADAILAFERDADRALCRSVLAVNSAEVDLARLEYVPEDRRLLVGQTHPRVKGHGTGADPDLGAGVVQRDRSEVMRGLDEVPLHVVDAFLVIAGLGGGTGSGGAPVVCEAIRDRFAESVYGLGVLPGRDEGGRASLNAARSLQSFVDATDNLVLFDNDAWRESRSSLESGYEQTNREIATRIVTLLAAGELDGSKVSETAMDASDVRRTLATGGISTVAYASAPIEPETRRSRGLIGSLRTNGESSTDASKKVFGLVRQAVRSRLTCPADVESAERSLIVVSGPPKELSRKGLERARDWVETQTGSIEVLAGDDPRRGTDTMAAAVVLSNVTEVPRVDRLQDQAVDAKENLESQAAERHEAIDDLVTDPGDELDPI